MSRSTAVRDWATRASNVSCRCLCVILLAACSSRPGGDEIVANLLDAIGPDRARDSVRSLRTVAEGTGPTGLFVTSVTSIRPDTVYFHQQTGLGATEIWSTPERTWGGSQGEAYAEFGPSVRRFVRHHEFHLLLLDLRERFSDFVLQGEDSVNDAPCLRVTMTDDANEQASLCVREEDWRPLELVLESADAGGAIRIEFGDWKPVEGLNLFHSFRLHEGQTDVFTYEYVDISASSFGQETTIPPPTLPERPR